MKALVTVALALALALAPGVAAAYPQFQLSKDQTCTSCHLSPAGGLLLGENGLATADTISTSISRPRPGMAAVGPSWLQISA